MSGSCLLQQFVVECVTMALPKLTKLELRIMEILWSKGPSSIRDIQEAFPERNRPAYTTVQTIVYRLEFKKAVRRGKKVGNAHIFAAALSRVSAQRRMIDDLLGIFGGRPLSIVSHLVESGRVTPEELREAQKTLRKSIAKEKPQ